MRRLFLVALALTGCTSGRPVAAPSPSPLAPVSAVPSPSTSPTARPSARPSARPTPSRSLSPKPRATTAAASAYDYVFPVQGCRVSYAHSHHDYPATDIFAARGCSVVAVIEGTVDEVSRVDRWDSKTNRGEDRGGLSVSIVGADGVRYYGSHLSVIAGGIAPGVHVKAGQLLGRVGSTGSARGISPHLHFGISWPTGPGNWAVRRGAVYPWPYLDSWRAGGNRSPVVAVDRARRGA